MPIRKKVEVEDQSLEKLLELIDSKVKIRGKAVLTEIDATEEIARLVSEAYRKGATMPDLAQRVRRVDRKTRKLVPVSRQALDTMRAVHEKRREPKTTRASRRRRVTGTDAGRLNEDIFGGQS